MPPESHTFPTWRASLQSQFMKHSFILSFISHEVSSQHTARCPATFPNEAAADLNKLWAFSFPHSCTSIPLAKDGLKKDKYHLGHRFAVHFISLGKSLHLSSHIKCNLKLYVLFTQWDDIYIFFLFFSPHWRARMVLPCTPLLIREFSSRLAKARERERNLIKTQVAITNRPLGVLSSLLSLGQRWRDERREMRN